MSIKITQGANAPYTVKIRNEEGDPIDISTATEIIACFRKADGTTYVEDKLSLGEVTLVGTGNTGMFTGELSTTESGELEPSLGQTLYVSVTLASGTVYKIEIENAYDVHDFPC